MGDQLALLTTLDHALDYFRRIERERNQALMHLEALEEEVTVLRVLTSLTSARSVKGISRERQPAAETAAAVTQGLYNRGWRDRVLLWLAAALAQSLAPDSRRWAAFAIGVMGDPRLIPALGSTLNDADRAVRTQAVIALGRIGTAPAIAPLMRALRDGDRGVREKAIEALGNVRDPAIRPLVAGLRSSDAALRSGSSEALVRIGALAVSPLVRLLTEDDDKITRIAVVGTLGKMREDRAVASLVVALMDPDSDIQDTASQALVRTGKPAVVPLVHVLRVAGNPFGRRVLEVLVRIRGPAIEPLIELLQDGNDEVRLMASEALVKIGTPALGSLRRALKDPRPRIRLEAAAALGLIGDPAAVKPLVLAVRGRDRELRQGASAALARIGKPAAGSLVSLFKDADAGVREQASQALLEIGRPAFEPLCVALHEADFGTRCEAAQVLSTLRSRGHLRGLHGEWERIVDETALLAWFNSGLAQDRTERSRSQRDSKRGSAAAVLRERLPNHRKRDLGQSGNAP